MYWRQTFLIYCGVFPGGVEGEIQPADTINIYAKKGKVNAAQSTVLHFDCGSVDGFLAAISHVPLRRNSDDS